MLKIGWITAIDPSGYSSCARSYIHALNKNDRCTVNTIITNVSYNINLQGIDSNEINFHSNLAVNNFENLNAVVNHCVPDSMKFSFKNKNILYTICEMEIPERWVDICNACDTIMTASEFSKNNFIDSGVISEKIHIVPHCHDPLIWNSDVKKMNIKNLKGFNFLFVGDYTPRKGGDILIKNYIKAFEGNRDVSLTIKAYFNSFSLVDQKKLVERIKKIIIESKIPKNKIPTIYFYGDPIDEKLMPNFMNSFDCLISPHRGEGWGLCLSSMMFLGKPTIATNYSGNLQFMNSENSYLVDIDGFENVSMEMCKINPNFENKKWVKIDENSLIERMKEVFGDIEKAREKGKLASKQMVETFSDKIISNKIIDILSK